MQSQSREGNRVSRRFFVILFVFSLLVSALAFTSSKAATTSADKSIPMIGLNSNDATITDMNGHDVTSEPKLSKDFIYTLNYHWRVPDQIVIAAGDMAKVNLPATVVIQTDLSFPVKDPKTGAVIGKFSAKAGSQTALLTFTDFFSHSTVGRTGTLTFTAQGTYDDHEHHQVGWYIAKSGWAVLPPANASAAEKAQYVDSLGRPKILQWEITVNPQMVQVNHLVLNDTLGSGQTFDATRKIQVETGSYSQGAFHQSGTINPNYQITGNQIKIELGNIDQTIKIDLWTNPNPTSFAQTTTWTNQVSAEGQNQGSGLPTNAKGKIVWTDNGSGNGKVGQVTLTKRDQDQPKKVLTGAVFALYRANHTLVHANLTTDTQGQLTVRQLLAGSYYFVETKAPNGYERNQTPLPFTINIQHPQVTIQANDQASVTPPPVKPSTSSMPSASASKPSESGSRLPSTSSKPSTPVSDPSTSTPKRPSTSSEPSTSVSDSSASRPKGPSTSSEPSTSVSNPSVSRPKDPSASSEPSTSVSDSSNSSSKLPSTSSESPTSVSSSSTSRPKYPSTWSEPSTSISDSSNSSAELLSKSNNQPGGTNHSQNQRRLPDTGERLKIAAAMLGSFLTLIGVVLFVKVRK
ncbi:hypothetical protein KTT66_04640 [Lacticaseibacillus casei]|uniref:SpaA isopeptide-forming pilin-related protein n=1 Tax=Lacticaseibacillus TaxID=2759736 RepID=UPI000665DE63|nr:MULTISPECIES: SpaA isopeptide-forming pilin-related protein [Lacticaseibacillus]MDG3062871.1 SpaA isopeptide-forming pilin-related protein [Lacticaseibacillus sp. BCRC 81376]QVI38300.1 hypothetical protein KGS74_04815 [Lacticaseibacillus casei]QXG60113.1 hypothetical protein KTT66_04640 [Lacticaseibacillus casei]WFB42834.1 SpaA isopeptide-forming pilin-related protein [Lacticaseibacillus huelsenbergensis]